MAEADTDENDTLDPRVQIELERLNTATDDINKLEVDLDEARLVFRQLLYESTLKIQSLTKKLGNCIDKSRPYYEARFRANKALQEMRSAAVLYEKANSAHSAAREMVYLAEQGLSKLCSESGAGGVPLDPAWQEMLNHATARVNQSEAERGSAGIRHRLTVEQHKTAVAIARATQNSLKRHITKSRPYFEEKAKYNALLDSQKNKVQMLEKEVSKAKITYAEALRNLEQISDEIHQNRNKNRHNHITEKIHSNKPNESEIIENSENIPHKEDKPLADDNTLNEVCHPAIIFSKSDTVREWINKNGVASPESSFNDEINLKQASELKPGIDEKNTLNRPKSLPQDFSDKYSDILTPFQPNAPSKQSLNNQTKENTDTPSTVGKNGQDSDNWIEINLEYSSPEEIGFEKCTNFSTLDGYKQIPYERMHNVEQPGNDVDNNKVLCSETPNVENVIPNSKVSADSPRRIIRNRLVSQKSLPLNSIYYQNKETNGDNNSITTQNMGSSFKTKLKPDISNWINRSSAKDDEAQFSPTRRQSLDVLLNDTGEKVKEIFNQGFQIFNISSITERRNSEPKVPLTEKLSPQGIEVDQLNKIIPTKAVRKMPSPLDKTFSYLNVYNENSVSSSISDDQGSDTDSLASIEMLTEDQINSLMLDGQLEVVCQQMLGIAGPDKVDE